MTWMVEAMRRSENEIVCFFAIICMVKWKQSYLGIKNDEKGKTSLFVGRYLFLV